MVGAQPPASGTDEHLVSSLWRGERIDVVVCGVPLPY
jgi:hypothetical protein